jgi:predicted naringenin-chalcone synthase
MQLYRREAPSLSEQAAREALERSGLPPRAITHLVTVSCTGFQAPGIDATLIRTLGLPAAVERANVGFMGCHGAIDGLRVAQAFCDADPASRVLVCAVELCSLHYFFGWDPKKLVANALFSDGAAAAVGVQARHPNGDWRVAATGACLFPGSEEVMTWQIGDHGFEMTLAARVPSLISEHLRPWLESWLGQHNMALAGVRSWSIHPGGPRILSAVESALGLGREATAVSREILYECGNMSSATILFILDRLRRGSARRPCVALSFGPGLTAEAALLL